MPASLYLAAWAVLIEFGGLEMGQFTIPVTPPPMGKARHDYPIPEGENLLRAFRHEKPRYMPCLYQATQFVGPSA